MRTSMAPKRSSVEVPTAPGRLPLAGHAPWLHRDALRFVRELRRHGPVTKIYIGPRPVHVLSSGELIRELLTVRARSFDKGAMFDALRVPLGDGLITAAGDRHLRHRRMMQPAFHHERIARCTRVMTDCSGARSAAWEPGTTRDLMPDIHRLTLDILLGTLFAHPQDPGLRPAVKDWLAVKYHSMRLALSPLHAWAERVPLLPGWRPPDPGPLRRLVAVLRRIVETYRADGRDHGDLLSMLLLAEGPDGALTDAEVTDELITLFLAGTGTVSAALAWALYEISRRPEVQRRLHDELDTVLAGRPPGFEDLPALIHTRQILTETLRLRPPSWLLMRRAVRPVRLGGVHLSPGEEVFFSPYALHRDPHLYEDPERFDPERWPRDSAAKAPRHLYLPFGAGSRLCIGEDFAWAELTLALAAFTAHRRIAPADAAPPVRPLVGTVLRPDRLLLTGHPRRAL
ncbi:cytochrome P450 [Streptomyces rectiverticillatus]|uniref:cytochrome P450 n=1 Tax=Streptomyces rectiverticillatus TaxID=173860 RepID=UPI0015C3F92B|nr:cytochrome P450 [Streptomyces rectiverticillatus]QLE75466.1 cytochrome P450 [Streptomyces rectiverticillatus]